MYTAHVCCTVGDLELANDNSYPVQQEIFSFVSERGCPTAVRVNYS